MSSKPRSYSSEAIVLARRNYSETDRILVVFSKDYGKISLIAKGVRKTKSRKRGALEVFSLIKFSAARGKSLDILTEAEIIKSYQKIRKDLKKVAVAYYFMEIMGRVTQEEEKNIKLFNLLLANLEALKKQKKLKSQKTKFVEETLSLLGFWPQGKRLKNPDSFLEEVVEREMFSKRVGKRLLS